MSPRAAKAVSIGVVSGLAVILFLSQGLPVWAGLMGWAAYLDVIGEVDAVKRTIAATTFGISVGWVGQVVAHLIPVPPHTWLWIPRVAFAVAVTLPILALRSRQGWLSRISPCLYGYAAVFGILAVPPEHQTNLQRLTELHLYNPLLLLTISMSGGALFGLAATKLGGVLATRNP